MIEILKKHWEFVLYEHEERHYLRVMCGSIGMYEIYIALNEEEEIEFSKHGKVYIEDLARQITKAPKSYMHRHSSSLGESMNS